MSTTAPATGPRPPTATPTDTPPLGPDTRSLGTEVIRAARAGRDVAQRNRPVIVAYLVGLWDAIGGAWHLTGPTVLNLPLPRARRIAVRIGALVAVACIYVVEANELNNDLSWLFDTPRLAINLLALVLSVPLLLLPAGALIAWRAAMLVGVALLALPGPVLPFGWLAIVAALTVLAARAERWPVAAGMWTIMTAFGVGYTLRMAVFTTAASWYAVSITVASALLCALGQALRGRREAREESVHDRAVAMAEEERGVVLRERARIARELHDIVTHHMSAIAIQAQAAPLRDPDLPAAAAQTFATIESTARSALADLRTVIGMLRDDDVVEPREPRPTLREVPDLAARLRELGQAVSFGLDLTRPVPLAISTAGYRIVQESLTNARRHAPGQPVTVQIELEGDDLEITVTNPLADGAHNADEGHGIVGMRERAEALGGLLTAGADGAGNFRLRAVLPVPRQEA